MDCRPKSPQSSSLQAISVNEPQLPVYTATPVSKSLPQVVILTVPVVGGTNVNQTPLPNVPVHVGNGSFTSVALVVCMVKVEPAVSARARAHWSSTGLTK